MRINSEFKNAKQKSKRNLIIGTNRLQVKLLNGSITDAKIFQERVVGLT